MRVSSPRPKSEGAYAVLAQVSPGYSPLEGRLSTCYSPVRHSTHGLPHFLVRLACVRRAASVDSEPGSNSRRNLRLGNQPGNRSLTVAARCGIPQRSFRVCRPVKLKTDEYANFASNQIFKDHCPAGSTLHEEAPRPDRPRNILAPRVPPQRWPTGLATGGEKPSTRSCENLKDRSGRLYSAPACTGVLLPDLPNRRHHNGTGGQFIHYEISKEAVWMQGKTEKVGAGRRGRGREEGEGARLTWLPENLYHGCWSVSD